MTSSHDSLIPSSSSTERRENLGKRRQKEYVWRKGSGKWDYVVVERGEVEPYMSEVPKHSHTGSNLSWYGRARFRLLRFVEHIGVQLLSVSLVLVDVTLSVVALATSNTTYEKESIKASNVILGYFVLEIMLRFMGIGPKWFVRNPWEILDAAVITACVITAVSVNPLENEFSRLTTAARFFRLIRFIRLLPLCFRCIKSMRLVTSENKRRFRRHGFDLDLTYVTDKIIAMSFPSSGWLQLYRNPIVEVSRFFNERHGPNNYKLYNLCAEMEYDDNYFNKSVKRYMIYDHNVPTLKQMRSFVLNTESFLSEDPGNVIAVHCKGGKGRTGSMICAYLMYSQPELYPTGLSARKYFAHRRTDFMMGTKFQGVQTPSQCRYIDYFESIIHDYNLIIPAPPTYFIHRIIIKNPPAQIQSLTSDLRVEICSRTEVIASFQAKNFNHSSLREITYQNGELVFTFYLNIMPLISGDIKLRFKSRHLPVKYDNVSFFFWFNTLFVEKGVVEISRDMLDNPHFKMYNNVYSPDFGVKLDLQNCDDECN